MMRKREIKTVCLVAITLWLGCENIIDEKEFEVELATNALETDKFNSHEYNLSSEKAKLLFGKNSIPRRATNYKLDGIKKLPILKFKSYNDKYIKTRLAEFNKITLEKEITEDEIVDNGAVFSVSTEDGYSMCSKDTGACDSEIHTYPRGISKIKSAEEAVNLALEKMAEKGLLDLSENETLDVVSVTHTEHAGWIENDGQLEPVHFEGSDGKESVTHFTTDYTVSFGRRYKGVPIMGPTLSVRLEPQGRISAFTRNWRDIEGEEEDQAELLSDIEIEGKINQGLASNLELEGMMCGYMEAPGSGYHQEKAGIGCRFSFNDSDAKEMMASKKTKEISIAKDSSLSIEGEMLSFVTPADDEETSTGVVEDIPE